MLTVTADTTKADIAEAIALLKHEHDRLPIHFTARRAPLMDEIETLLDEWRKAPA